jgi:hypothetical protein
MTSALHNLAAAGAAALQSFAGQTVEYRRGSSSAVLTAVEARGEGARDEGSVTSLVYGAQDFLILAGDLEIDGVAIEPAAGDVIAASRRGESETGLFQVLEEPGLPAAVLVAGRWRIHTKRVGSEPA